jgi:glycosyltransferase involved in cell wall biosynthesis
MKKTALFFYPVMNAGGAEKSTLRMLRALCDRGWQITLVLITGGGVLESEIDPRVTVVRLRPRAYGQRFLSARGFVDRMRALPDLLSYGFMRLVGAARMVPFLFRHYDAAATGIHSTSSFFVRRVIRCERRFHWIRSDLHLVDPHSRLTAKIASVDSRLDGYICVSETARRSLLERIPQARGKARVIYNIIDAKIILEKSKFGQTEIMRSGVDQTNIVTVCRLLDRDKALFRMVRVCRSLKDEGFAFKWFLIGDGPDRGVLDKAIRENGLEKHLVLLGYKENPYPYYIGSDLVAMVSYHEGLSGMINEAKVCGQSVFAVRVSGVEEQLTHGVNGWIVENEEQQIIEGLRKLLSEPDLISKTRNFLYPEEILSDKRKIDLLENLFLGRETSGDIE